MRHRSSRERRGPNFCVPKSTKMSPYQGSSDYMANKGLLIREVVINRWICSTSWEIRNKIIKGDGFLTFRGNKL